MHFEQLLVTFALTASPLSCGGGAAKEVKCPECELRQNRKEPDTVAWLELHLSYSHKPTQSENMKRYAP